jgi:RNA recognition motif-containing protein
MGRRLLIGNLNIEAREEDLKELFSEAGTVRSVELVTDPNTGRKKGFAFVEMSTDAETKNAITLFDGKEFDGRLIIVNACEPAATLRQRWQFNWGRGGNASSAVPF